MTGTGLYLSNWILGTLGALIILKHAGRFGLLDCPNSRSSHFMPTPKGGGIGIVVAFSFSSWLLGIESTFWMPAISLALLSFFGDTVDISPKYRLPLQFVAAFIFLIPLYYSYSAGTFRWGTFFLFAGFLIFIVGTTNHYNFMDGINGIAGITGVIGFGMIAFFAHSKGADPSIISLPICMAFACIGFLPFNIPKARVFMGDVGSILLGFVFGCLVIWVSESFSDFIIGSSFLLPFYADELSTMVVRLKDGENLTTPHRRHLYQLMANEKGIAHWKISTGYGISQLGIGSMAVLLGPYGLLPLLTFAILCFAAFSIFSFQFRTQISNAV